MEKGMSLLRTVREMLHDCVVVEVFASLEGTAFLLTVVLESETSELQRQEAEEHMRRMAPGHTQLNYYRPRVVVSRVQSYNVK